MESFLKPGSNTVFLTILLSLVLIETTTALPDSGGVYNKDDIPMIFSGQNVFYPIISQFHMLKVRPNIESLRKSGSTTVLLTTMVSLMMIGTTTARSDER